MDKQRSDEAVDWQAILENRKPEEGTESAAAAEAREVHRICAELMPWVNGAEERLVLEIEAMMVREGVLPERSPRSVPALAKPRKERGYVAWFSVAATLAVVSLGLLLCRPVPLATLGEVSLAPPRTRGPSAAVGDRAEIEAWTAALRPRVEEIRQARWQGGSWTIDLTFTPNADGGAHVLMEARRGRQSTQWEGAFASPLDDAEAQRLSRSLHNALRGMP